MTVLVELTNAGNARCVVTGGGSRITRLIDRKRQLGRRPVEPVSAIEATALGAATLARRAMGDG